MKRVESQTCMAVQHYRISTGGSYYSAESDCGLVSFIGLPTKQAK